MSDDATPDRLTDYRLNQLEAGQKDHEVRLHTIEIWQAGVEGRIKEKVDEQNIVAADHTKDWIKITITALTIIGALVTYLTTR